ncbi:MAG: hypothetical protein IPH44_00995 [Myxococcales bacterium]|nr:hypothetical protein [Myxococcales bacterium]
MELPAVMDNRAWTRAGEPASMPSRGCPHRLEERRGQERAPTAIAGAPFFTTHTARAAIPDHFVVIPEPEAAEPGPDPRGHPVGLAIVAAWAATLAALAFSLSNQTN